MPLSLLLAGVLLVNAPAAVSQANADAVWACVQTLAGDRTPAPELYFPEEDEPDPSPHFLAYYYTRTNIIRFSPYLLRVGSEPPQIPGFLLHEIGHEMLHYALAPSIPIAQHHRVFTERGYDVSLAAHLVAAGLAHPLLVTLAERAGSEGRWF